MFRLYFDEDSLDRGVIAGARRLGFDCSSASEESRQGYADEDQLDFATSAGRVIFTNNVGDFARLHWAWQDAGRRHHGVMVLTRQDMPIGDQLRALQRMASELTDEEMQSSLVYLTYYARSE